MVDSLLNYPAQSSNLGRKRSRFWNKLGFEVATAGEIEQAAEHLYNAPACNFKPVEGTSDYSTGLGSVGGDISLAAARKLVGEFIDDGYELSVRMLEAGTSPETSESYDGVFEVRNLSLQERRSIPNNYADPLFVKNAPEEFDHGKKYDFVVTGLNEPETW